MAKFILGAALALVLAGCGGGSGSNPFTPPASCTPKTVTIQLYGDSTNYGQSRASLTSPLFRVVHYPELVIQQAMDAKFGAGAVVVSTMAIPGSTVKNLLAGDGNLFGGASYEKWPLGADADFVVVNYGINDFNAGVSATDFAAQLTQLAAARSVIFETPLPDDGQDGLVAQTLAVATAAGMPLIDVAAYVRSLPDWSTHTPDGTHPDDAGYLLIEQNVVAPGLIQQVAPLRCVKA